MINKRSILLVSVYVIQYKNLFRDYDAGKDAWCDL